MYSQVSDQPSSPNSPGGDRKKVMPASTKQTYIYQYWHESNEYRPYRMDRIEKSEDFPEDAIKAVNPSRYLTASRCSTRSSSTEGPRGWTGS